MTELQKNNKSDLLIHQYSHFLKGDVSGIQDFIFNVKSKGASKSLKARSYFIQAMADITIAVIKEKLGETSIREFYNGGGNFYLFCNADVLTIDSIQSQIQKALLKEDLHLFLSLVETKHAKNFNELWFIINEKSGEDKLQKHINHFEAFQPFTKSTYTDEQWRLFTKKLSLAEGACIEPSSHEYIVQDNKFSFINKSLKIGRLQDISFENNIINKLPLWEENLIQRYSFEKDDDDEPIVENNIISFGMMARFAKERTGTDKVGVLKLDLDNLGDTFRKIIDENQIIALSKKLSEFFSKEVFYLWNNTSFIVQSYKRDEAGELLINSEGGYVKEDMQIPYKHNLYFVFAGGDDCFIIGAWDAVFEFTNDLKLAFDAYMKHQTKVTFSASLLLLSPHYPMVQLADEAEDCLKAAKRIRLEKNAINVMGEIMDWETFTSVKNIAHDLQELIMFHNEPKNILHRISNSQQYFDGLASDARNGQLLNPKVWRLKYFLARKRKERQSQQIIENIVNDFMKTLLHTATNRNALNAKKYEIAARWAELLTRKF